MGQFEREVAFACEILGLILAKGPRDVEGKLAGWWGPWARRLEKSIEQANRVSLTEEGEAYLEG